MTVYKVVCIRAGNGNYIKEVSPNSYFTSVIGGEMSLKYHIGENTVPVIGRLFGFDTVENAIHFIKYFQYGSAVLEGEAENVGRVKFLAEVKDVLDFWKTKKMKKKLHNVYKAPLGTISFSSFVPTKVVYKRE